VNRADISCRKSRCALQRVTSDAERDANVCGALCVITSGAKAQFVADFYGTGKPVPLTKHGSPDL
jgi:hypothetical protein